MRGRNLIKLLRALDLLSRPQGATIKELAERLEIDRRSVYRLIDVMGELNFPVWDDKAPLEREKRWRLLEDYVIKLPNITLPDVRLSLSEIVALHLVKSEAKLYRGTDIEKIVDSAFGKISLYVPNGLYDQLQKIKTLFVPSSKFAKDYAGKEEIIDSMTDAMLQRKTCYVKYHSFSDDQVKNFKIDPLCFFESNGGLYVFVRATSFHEIRILAVERIQGLEVTDSLFDPPDNFDPEALLDSAFDIVYDDPIEVKIWFSPDQAKYVKERTWAKEQKITDQPDGSIVLEMKTSGWWHVKKWVLSFGAEARVIEPAELRDDVLGELIKAADSYRLPINRQQPARER